MTLDELVERFQRLGFLCSAETRRGITKMGIEKRATTPGNRLEGCRWQSLLGGTGSELAEVDGPSPDIRIENGRIRFGFSHRVPGPPNPYEKQLTTFDELYEELLHYWFDADSPMSTEEGFIPGSGRPPGV